MPKKSRAKRRPRRYDIPRMAASILELMLLEYGIGPDFILRTRDPYNADIGYLDPKALRTFDQDYVESLIAMAPINKLVIPRDLKNVLDIYVKQRVLLSDYHDTLESLIFDHDVVAAKELQNYDKYSNKVVIRNDAEMNVFCDYIALYRKIEDKRSIVYWNSKNEHNITSENKMVVEALEKAKFAILRLDKNLEHSAIRATNIITQQEVLLIDIALNRSKNEGYFFICSLLDMGTYFMTSGGGIPIDATSPGGKSVLTLSKKHLDTLRKAEFLDDNIMECVREIYGICLRGRALINMESNTQYRDMASQLM